MPHYRAVDWKPDGSYALIADSKGNFYRYPASNGNHCIELIHNVIPGAERVDAINWWDNDTALACGGNWPTYNNGFIQRCVSSWSVIYQQPPNVEEKYWDIARRPGGDKALAVGEGDPGGSMAVKCDTNSATRLDPPGPDFASISWKPDGSYATITSDARYLWKYDPSNDSFTNLGRPVSSYSNTDNDWHPGGNYTLLVGLGGTIRKWSEANGFEDIPSPFPNTIRLEKAEWSPCGTTALTVGMSGSAARYDGQTVTELDSGTGRYLNDVSWKDNNEALIVGDFGTVLRYERSTDNFYVINPC